MRKVKHVLLYSLIIIATIISTFVVSGVDPTVNRFHSKENGFSILLPRGWSVVENPRAAIHVRAPRESMDDQFQANINVMMTDLPNAISMDTFFDANREELLRVMPLATNMVEGVILAGFVQGRLLTFENKVEGINLKSMSAVFKKDTRFYSVNCTAEEAKISKYLPIFKKVIQSLRID